MEMGRVGVMNGSGDEPGVIEKRDMKYLAQNVRAERQRLKMSGSCEPAKNVVLKDSGVEGNSDIACVKNVRGGEWAEESKRKLRSKASECKRSVAFLIAL